MADDNVMTSEEATEHPAESGHPTPLTYFKVAMTLSAITAVEVGIFYIEDLGKGIIPILVVLSGAKFALVAMFYMHLRYDARLFSAFFVGGLALAVAVVLAVLALFNFFAGAA